MKRLVNIILTTVAAIVAAVALTTADVSAQRRITPVQPTEPTRAPEKAKRPVADKPVDPSRLTEALDANGNKVLVDTVTGVEYADSVIFRKVPPMEFPLLYALTVGVNVWDPVMRLFGQKYGVADIWAELSLHNRYKPRLEFGLGTIKDTPSGLNYSYRSALAPYFKIGADYNFLYNSNPDYQLLAGLRYGFTRFSYEITDFTLGGDYWGENSELSIPRQTSTTGYLEIALGLRVRIAGPVSLGWNFAYHSIMHESKAPYGNAMYIPGFGKRNSSIAGAFSIMYTIGLNKKPVSAVDTQ